MSTSFDTEAVNYSSLLFPLLVLQSQMTIFILRMKMSQIPHWLENLHKTPQRLESHPRSLQRLENVHTPEGHVVPQSVTADHFAGSTKNEPS